MFLVVMSVHYIVLYLCVYDFKIVQNTERVSSELSTRAFSTVCLTCVRPAEVAGRYGSTKAPFQLGHKQPRWDSDLACILSLI